MPTQNNFIRPSSTYNSASSTMKLDGTETTRRKTSIVILTMLSMIIFLFILCKFNGQNRNLNSEGFFKRSRFVYDFAISAKSS